jgi:hypothetical protein
MFLDQILVRSSRARLRCPEIQLQCPSLTSYVLATRGRAQLSQACRQGERQRAWVVAIATSVKLACPRHDPGDCKPKEKPRQPLSRDPTRAVQKRTPCRLRKISSRWGFNLQGGRLGQSHYFLLPLAIYVVGNHNRRRYSISFWGWHFIMR